MKQNYFNARVFVLLSLFMLLFAGVSYVKVRLYLEENLMQNQKKQLLALEFELKRWMQQQKTIVLALSKNLEGVTNKEVIKKQLKAYKKLLEAVQVYYGTKDGFMFYDANKEQKPWYDPRVRPWYKEALEGKNISKPFVGKASNQATFTIMAEVEKQGVVAASFFVKDFYQFLSTLGPKDTFLTDDAGRVMMHLNPEYLQQKLATKSKAFQALFTPTPNIELYKGFYVGALSFENGWHLVTVTSKAKAFLLLEDLVKLFSLLASLSLALFILLIRKQKGLC